jgi:AraC-like DNA-binding protein
MYINKILAPEITGSTSSELSLEHIGLFESQGDFKWEQVASVSCLHCIHEGEGAFLTGGCEYKTLPGDIFLFTPNVHYEYFDSMLSPWKYTYLTFSSDQQGFMSLPHHHSDSPLIRLGLAHPLWDELHLLEKDYRKDRISRFTANRWAWRILEILDMNEQNVSNVCLGQKIMTFIDGHYHKYPTVRECESHFKLDRSTLFRHFKNFSGKSVKQYIEDKRFERVLKLLEVSPHNLQEIAITAGFDDPLYFSRAFKKRFGLSPSMYRQKSRKSLLH